MNDYLQPPEHDYLTPHQERLVWDRSDAIAASELPDDRKWLTDAAGNGRSDFAQRAAIDVIAAALRFRHKPGDKFALLALDAACGSLVTEYHEENREHFDELAAEQLAGEGEL